MNQKKLMTYGIIGFFALIAILLFSNSTFVTIDSGERGVIFRPFSSGLDKDNVYQPGFHLVAPWNDMYVYEIREKQLEEEMEVLSSNGLNIKVDVTTRINPDFGQIGNLHETFGRDYMNQLVRPEVRSAYQARRSPDAHRRIAGVRSGRKLY